MEEIEYGPPPRKHAEQAAIEVFVAQVEHTAQLAVEDGSEVTRDKLNAHVTQYREATADG